MAVVYLEGLCFSGFAWTFKLVPSKHLGTSLWSQRMIKVNLCHENVLQTVHNQDSSLLGHDVMLLCELFLAFQRIRVLCYCSVWTA